MSIELPNLDDKTFGDLVEEAQSALPELYPAWTDHNPSEPGVALIELFAWLVEAAIYRTNRITPGTRRAFLKILSGARRTAETSQEIEAALRATLRELREPYCAVTTADYEYHTVYTWPKAPEAQGHATIKRVRCLGERNVEGQDPTAAAPGHISLIVVPSAAVDAEPWLGPSEALARAMKAFFEDRKLVSTRLHVVGPCYVNVTVSATLYLEDDAEPRDTRAAAERALRAYYHPVIGGSDGAGFSFGRAVNPSEVYEALDRMSGIDFVEEVELKGHTKAISLAPHQLPQLATPDLTLMQRQGNQWQQVKL